MTDARTDAGAIERVQRALHDYMEAAGPAIARADAEMSRSEQAVRTRREHYVRQARQAEMRIGALVDTDPENRDENALACATSEFRSWTRKAEETERIAAELHRAHETFRGHRHRYTAAVTPLAELGRRRMTAAHEDVDRYETTQHVRHSSSSSWKGTAGGIGATTTSASSRSTGAAAGAAVPGAGGADTEVGGVGEMTLPGVPTDMTLVPVDLCDDEGRVTSPADFTNGKVTADEMIWAARSLFSDVLPRMARGGDVSQRLRDSDAGRGNSGTTTLAATHDGFFGSARIVLTQRADGSYEVTNGAHRLWAAREIGASHIPAEVRRRR